MKTEQIRKLIPLSIPPKREDLEKLAQFDSVVRHCLMEGERAGLPYEQVLIILVYELALARQTAFEALTDLSWRVPTPFLTEMLSDANKTQADQ